MHPDFVKSITVLPSGHVVTGCRDENIRVWDSAVISILIRLINVSLQSLPIMEKSHHSIIPGQMYLVDLMIVLFDNGNW